MKLRSRTLAAALLGGFVMCATSSQQAAMAASMTVTDVLVGQSALAITIPSIQVEDGNMSEADIRALFAGKDLPGLAKKLAGWNATRITIPEMKFSPPAAAGADGKKETMTIVYKGFVIEQLKNGVAASSVLAGGEFEGTGEATFKGVLGKASTGTFDFGALLGFYTGATNGAGDGIRTVYKDVGIEGMTLTGDKGLSCKIGAIKTAEFKARPMRTSLLDLMKLAESLNGKETPTAAELKPMVQFYADLFEGIESTPTTFDGFACKFADDKGRPVDFSMGKSEFGGFGAGRYPSLSFNDFVVSVAGDGAVKVGSFVFKGMALSAMLKTLEENADKLDSNWAEANYRKLIPALDGFSLANVDIDVPDTDNPSKRIKAKVGAFDLTLKDHQLGIPADISMTASNIQGDLPEDSTDETVQQLKALGYKAINVGFVVKAKWDESTSAIAIDELSATGENMGTVTISGEVGNAGKDIFAEDVGTMQGAIMGLSAKNLTVSLEDEGIADKAFDMAAKQQGTDGAALKQQVSGMAGGMIPMVLGGTEQAQAVSKAVITFLNGGKSISITATAKDEAGIGLQDLMAAQQDPTELVKKVDLEATAE